MTRRWWLAVMPVVMACTPQETSGPPAMDAASNVEDVRVDPMDAVAVDAMVTDRGVIDATGTPDAGMTAPDADPPDLGPPDTGVMPDVGFNFDSGTGACPTFNLAPATVDFGTLAEGMPRTQFFQVINTSMDPLTLWSIGLTADSTPEYTVTPQVPTPTVIMGGGRLAVTVSYLSTSPGTDTASVAIHTDRCDDPSTSADEAFGYVTLRATSVGPDIDVAPARVEFGMAAVGATVRRAVLVRNTGNAALLVTGFSMMTHAELSLERVPATPASVSPGGVVTLDVVYRPLDTGMDTSEILIASNDIDEPVLAVPVTGTAGVVTSCNASVAVSVIELGTVERGSVRDLPVAIKNTGARPCSFTNIALTGHGDLSIASGSVASSSIAVGDQHVVTVRYAPTAYGPAAGSLSFDANDPIRPQVQLPVSASSAELVARVLPQRHDFGTARRTCTTAPLSVGVFNAGLTPLTISAVRLGLGASVEYSLAPFAAPSTVLPNSADAISVQYRPQDLGDDHAQLHIDFVGGQSAVVPLVGRSTNGLNHTDTWVQAPARRADVLFVIDNGASMMGAQTLLAAAAPGLLQALDASQVDYHVGVTTGDIGPVGARGRLVGAGMTPVRVVTSSTPMASQVLAANLMVGTQGPVQQSGLTSAYSAVTDPVRNSPENSGFRRNDADFEVIHVAASDDRSLLPGFFFASHMRDLANVAGRRITVDALVASGSSCMSASVSAQPAARVEGVVMATGGRTRSICDSDYVAAMSEFAESISGRKRAFRLSTLPLVVTLMVTVDGVVVPQNTPMGATNWMYDGNTNSVVFDRSAVPALGAQVSASYSVDCVP